MKPSSLETVFELSPMQAGMLFHVLYAPTSSVYLNQSIFTVEGDLRPTAMASAWQRAVDRHQVLRCSFFWEGIDRPVQAVHRHVVFPPQVLDWSDRHEADREAALEDFLAADRHRPFDLRRPPQMRLAIIRAGAERYQVVWTRHHILFDGWSQALLLREVFLLYEAFIRRPDGAFDEAELVGPRVPFERYIGWLQNAGHAEAEIFWRAHLAGVRGPTPLGLAADRSGDVPTQYEVGRQLPSAVTAELETVARQSGLTVATLYQAAWALVLGSLSKSDDVIFGTTVSGRAPAVPDIEQMVGLFINSLPVRASLGPSRSFASFARELQQQHVRLIDHQHTPLVDIQRWAQCPLATSLFHTIVVIGNYPSFTAGQEASSLRVTAARSEIQNSLPITLRVMPGASTRISILYDARLLEGARATAMLDGVERILARIPSSLDSPLALLLAHLDEHEGARVHAALAANAQRLADLRRRPARRS